MNTPTYDLSNMLDDLLQCGWMGESNRSQKQLALLLNVSTATVSRWMNGAGVNGSDITLLLGCKKLPDWFREKCWEVLRGPTTSKPLDADGDGDEDLDDARIHSQRATVILQRVTSRGGRR